MVMHAAAKSAETGEAFAKGVDAIGKGRLKDALDQFHHACGTTNAPPRFELYRAWTQYQLALQNKKLGKNQRSAILESCRMTILFSLLKDRRFDAGYVLLGTIFIGEGRTERARQCFFKALSINPNNAGAQMGLKSCGGH